MPLAVRLLRDQLDLAIGSAVRSSGDAGLIIRWLSTDMGSMDFEAVEALGRLVGLGDARYLSFPGVIWRVSRASAVERAPVVGAGPKGPTGPRPGSAYFTIKDGEPGPVARGNTY